MNWPFVGVLLAMCVMWAALALTVAHPPPAKWPGRPHAARAVAGLRPGAPAERRL